MNITVTIEELRDYQNRMSDWFLRRLQAAQEMTVSDQMSDPYNRRSQLKWSTPIAQWVKENPMPLLIPTDV